MGKNIESLACTFIYFNFFGLGSIPFVLFINFPSHFRAFLAKFGDLSSLFFFLYSPLVDFIFFFIVAQLHAYVVCIVLPADLAVVLTWGSYFVFCF